MGKLEGKIALITRAIAVLAWPGRPICGIAAFA
jgi:hypothetical protein